MPSRALWLVLAVLLLACERVPAAPLLELSGVTPRRIELGDKLEIEGASLPEGREARVVLRGTLHRPGESPEDAELDTTGRVVARDRIEVVVGNELMGSLCGEGRSALHTTFSGSLDVIFAAQRPGAPPVSGTVEGVELDAVPQGVRRDDEEGIRALSALGIRLAPADTETDAAGLVVASVDPGSRAERGGIGAGDRIVSFADVRTLSAGDVALPPGRTSTTARIAHGSSTTEEEVGLSIDGVAPPARGRVSLGLALAALVAAAIMALMGPFARALAWTERRLGEGLATSSSVGWPALTAMIAVALVLPLGKSLFAARVDLALVSVTILLAWVSLELSKARGLRDVWTTLSEHAAHAVAPITAIATIGIRDGSLSAGDVLRAQGFAPWEMTAARSPVGVVSLAILLLPWALPSKANEGERAHVPTVFACAVAVTSSLGGWRSLDVPPNHVSSLGVALFMAKVAGLFWLVTWVRRSLPIVTTRAWVRVVWPLAFATAAADLMCQRLAVSPIAGSVTGLAVLALFAFVVIRAKRISRGDLPRVHADALL